jgi:LEA14-like dessication related protein
MKLFITIILSLQTLITFSAIEVPKIKSIDSLKLKNDDNNILTLISNVTIENTNVFDISGKDLKILIFYDKFNLGIGQCDESFRLDSKSTSPIKINIKLYLDSIPENLRMKLFEMDSIPLKMKLSFKGSLGIKHKQDGEFNLKISDLQSALINSYFSDEEIELKDMKVESSTMMTTKFGATLMINNKIPLDLLIKSSEISIFDLKKGGTKIGLVEMNKDLKIEKNTISQIPSKFIIDNNKAAVSGFGKALSGYFDYFAIGNILLTMHDLDFKVPINLHFVYYPLSNKVKIIKQ